MCACNKARVVSHLTFLFSGLGFSRRIEREPGDDCTKPLMQFYRRSATQNIFINR